jgi:phage terminase large subunit-like protein
VSPELSLAERLALLDQPQREAVLKDFSDAGYDMTTFEFDARFWLRPKQLQALDSNAWLTSVVAGRGFGKTLTLAQWVREKAKIPATRIALVARTVADVRDTVVQGEAGVLSVHPPDMRPEYVPSLRRILWPNGSIAYTFTSSEPGQLRGPSFHVAACDELAAWNHRPDDSGLTAWDNIKIATRLGENPQIFVSTTPKRNRVMREVFDLARSEPGRVKLITGSTLDNRAHLSDLYLSNLFDRYRGTALAKQELLGELLEVVEGALWREDDVVMFPLDEYSHGALSHVVGVDPAATSQGDSTGIVVVYGTTQPRVEDRLACVMEDLTVEGAAPEVWAARVVDAAKRHAHPDGRYARIVAEKNQGGEMIAAVLRAEDPDVKVTLVHASTSKAARAEPVVLAYRRRRITHDPDADLDLLVDEMTSWEPYASRWSPGRVDAMVHACRALLLGRVAGPLTIVEPGARAESAYANAVLPVLPDRTRPAYPDVAGMAGPV